MQLVGIPSGVTVIHPCSTCAQVAATVQAASECGQFVAIKYEANGQVAHHPRAPADRIELFVGSPPPANLTSKPPDTTRNYQHTSGHHQEIPASNHEEVPQGIRKAPGVTMNHPESSSRHLGSDSQPPSHTL